MAENSPDNSKPPFDVIAHPVALEAWEAKIIPISYPPIHDRTISLKRSTVHHWGLLLDLWWTLNPACDAPPPSLVMGIPPHVFVERAGAHPEQYCQRCAALAAETAQNEHNSARGKADGQDLDTAEGERS